MHDMLFVLIWLLTVVCSFLRGARFALGIITFIACQMLLWHSAMQAMSAPNWDESAGDWLVPIVITLPTPVFAALIMGRMLLLVLARLLSRHSASDERGPATIVFYQESPLLADNTR